MLETYRHTILDETVPRQTLLVLILAATTSRTKHIKGMSRESWLKKRFALIHALNVGFSWWFAVFLVLLVYPRDDE